MHEIIYNDTPVRRSQDERHKTLLHAQYVHHCTASVIHQEVAIDCHPPIGVSYGLRPHTAFPTHCACLRCRRCFHQGCVYWHL